MDIKRLSSVLFLLLVVFISSCSQEDRMQDSVETEITREKATQTALEYVENSYQYVQYNGHNLQQNQWGRTADGSYLFSYEFDVDSELLPSRVTGIEMTLYIVEDGSVKNVTATELP